MHYKKIYYGKTIDGSDVEQIFIENDRNMMFSCITYGGIITSVCVPDRNGKVEDISPGFKTIEEYEKGASIYFGALLGRFANRIRDGLFSLDGKEYLLSKNWKGKIKDHHMHGGYNGFDKRLWNAKKLERNEKIGVCLSRISPDKEEGYPGNVQIEVNYLIDNENTLTIEYFATTDKATPLNLSSHAFWNLAPGGTIKNHKLTLNSKFYLPVDDDLVSTGEILTVEETPMDFREGKKIGQDMDDIPSGGYDHCFCIDRKRDGLEYMATLYEANSGRAMDVFTTMPGFHFYSGFFMNNIKGKSIYPQFGALALETEFFPDCVNLAHFPNCILRPGEEYSHKTEFRFYTV